MPKVSKKKQVNHHHITLDTGHFSYRILNDTAIAHLNSIAVDPHYKDGEKLFPALIKQAEIILKKEGYKDIIYNVIVGDISPFTKQDWTVVWNRPVLYMEPLAAYLLHKDLTKLAVPKQSITQLLGDDHKARISNIIEGSSIPKPEIIDQELEPPPVPQVRGRRDMNFLDREDQRRIMDEIAPAEPFQVNIGDMVDGLGVLGRAPPPRPVAAARWIVDDALNDIVRAELRPQINIDRDQINRDLEAWAQRMGRRAGEVAVQDADREPNVPVF
jgi:hypothetical protein